MPHEIWLKNFIDYSINSQPTLFHRATVQIKE